MTLPFSDRFIQQPYFFDQGICFECLQCGGCCSGASGTIYLSEDEVMGISQRLGLQRYDFVERYCYPFKDSFSIGEDSQGRCLLFDGGCTIYPFRPLQCRTFPFWFSNMRSQKRWHRIVQQCPGIGAGRCYSRDQILAIARRTIHI